MPLRLSLSAATSNARELYKGRLSSVYNIYKASQLQTRYSSSATPLNFNVS